MQPLEQPPVHDPSMNLQRPSIGIFGFLGGLICGLALAVAVALYLTNSPVPFVNKVQHATENVNPEPGDPNRPLFSPQVPAGIASDPAAGRAASEAGDGPVGAAPSAPPPASPAPPIVAAPAAAARVEPAEAAGKTTGAGDAAAGARLMLQVGAFKNADDADVLRARIALLGLDAKVTPSVVEGSTLYRVRLGPYGQLDDLNGIRQTLSENGMEPQLVRVK